MGRPSSTENSMRRFRYIGFFVLGLVLSASNALVQTNPGGVISTVAGNGTFGSSGDGGTATMAQVGAPFYVAADGPGNLFIIDGDRIRKVSLDGVISTIAGTDTPGFSGDGGPAILAQFNGPAGLAV